MPEYLTLTSTKMETTSSFASAKTIVRVCFVLFLNPTSLLQKPVSQVEENNLSRMLLALGSRIAFATGGEQSGVGPAWFLFPFMQRASFWFTIWTSLLPLTHPFLEALVICLILEAKEKNLETGTQLLPTSSWVPSYPLDAHSPLQHSGYPSPSRPPCGKPLMVQHCL